jgi:HEAT repeat protein
MGKYAIVQRRVGWSPPAGNAIRRRSDIPELLKLSQDRDPRARRIAAKNLCPCHLRINEPKVWERLLELACDADPGVRSDAVHALGDGSPSEWRDRIVRTLLSLQNDSAEKVRKQVRRVLAEYRRTGSVNVL